MIFVDTGAWYASLVPTDPDYGRAVQWLAANHSPLLTTDYVIDEILTLLRVRGERKRALLLGARFFHHELAEIHKITAADLTLAWKTFEQFDDKVGVLPTAQAKSSWNNSVSLRRLLSTITSNNSEQFKSCLEGAKYATYVRFAELCILVDADGYRLCRQHTGAE